MLPWLHLKGISTGDFGEALAALLGPDAEGLSSSTIARLKATWWEEYEAWSKRDPKSRRYVNIWADGGFPGTRAQRCWVHKTASVLDAMPKSLHDTAKANLHDIWMAETKKEATAAFDLFVETYGVKYEKAVGKLVKDIDELLVFHDFPAEH